MKKIYAKLAGGKLNFFHPVYKASFVKMLSLSSIVALLSSASPLSSKTVASKKAFLISAKSPSVAFPQSVISVVDSAASNTSKDNYLTALNKVLASKVSASNDSNYANFLKNTLLEKSKPTINILAEASDLVRSIDMNAGSKKTTRTALTPRVVTGGQMTRDEVLGNPLVHGIRAEGKSHDAIVYGQVAQTNADQGIAIGLTALAGKSRSNKNCIAIGSSLSDSLDEKERTVSVGDFSIAFGSKAHNYSDNAIAIGYNAQVLDQAKDAIAIGYNSLVEKNRQYGVAVGPGAVSSNNDSISIGHMAHATGKSSVAIGGEYNSKSEHGEKDYTTAGADYTTALGSVSKAIGYGATVVGHRAHVFEGAKNAISFGFYSEAHNPDSIALGAWSKANVDGGIALGTESIAGVSAGVAGYSPLLGEDATDSGNAWKSTVGAVSVGNVTANKTRQITGVSAGTQDTDAVNIAQLKSLRTFAAKGWKLSINNKNATAISIDDTVDFSAGSSNFTITKGDKDNKMKFDLAKSLVLDSVKAGNNTLDATGLVIKDGPKIMTTGIDVGSKKITGVAKGTGENDAVNFSQLKEIKEQVGSGGFIKQDAETKHITIGKEADGEKIDIVNKDGKNRVLSGIANGTISDASTEAITGHQLHQFGTKIASYFGGGAGYKDGEWIAPKFKVKTVKDDGTEGEGNYNNVADAFAGVGNSFTNIHKEIKNEITNVVTDVKGDALLWSDKAHAFVARHEKSTEEKGRSVRTQENSKITFLLDGNVAKDSTDAVTGNQLYSMGDKVAKYLGGGASFSGGTWVDPSFKVKTVKDDGTEGEERYDNVAAAFEGVGTAITNVKNEITKQINKEISNVKGDSLVKKDASTNYITIGKEVEGSEINIVNSKNELRTLSGVKEAKNDNEAVNKGQLDTSIKKVEDKLTNVTEQVKGDALLWSKEANAFVARHEKSTEEKGRAVRTQENSKITFLANGDVSDTSTDAINGSQLFETNNKVTTYLGGGAGYDQEGNWKAPSFKIKKFDAEGTATDETYGDVAAAFEDIGSSITNVQNKVTNEITNQVNNAITKVEGENLVQQDKETHLITIGAKKGGAEINIADSTGVDRTLSGVKEATKDNEAVNKGQLEKSLKELQSDDSAVVHYDKTDGENGTINYGSVTLGGKNKIPVGLHNVASGTISSESYDAINGQQINKVGEDVAGFFGGGAAFSGGVFSKPSYGVHSIKTSGDVSEPKTIHHDVGSALGALDYNLGNVNTRITNTINDFNQKIKDSSQHIEKDALLWNDEAHAFVARHEKSTEEKGRSVRTQENSKITFLLDGDVSDASTDAITGKQLYSMGDKVAKYLGGGASFSGGTWVDPSFKVKTVNGDGIESEQSYDSVAQAFEGVGTAITNVKNEITNQINNEISNVKGDSLVKQDAETKVINIGKEVEGGEINIANKDKEDRLLSGVKNGELSKTSQQAVNGSQLFTTNENVTTVTNDLQKVASNTSGYFGGGADVLKGDTPSFSIQDSTYHTVAEAFAGVDSSFTKLHNEISKNNTEVSERIEQNALLWNDDAHAFVARHEQSKEEKGRSVRTQENSKITFLLDGNVSEGSTDAVTGNQLYSMGHALSTYLGGGAKYEEGKWSSPSFKVKTVKEDGSDVEEKSYECVAEAFAGVGSSFTNIHKELKNEITNVISDSLVKQDKETHVISVGSEKSGTEVTLANTDGAARTLSGVKAGVLSAESTDGINGSQLFATNQNVSTVFNDLKIAATSIAKSFGGGAEYKESKWIAPSFKVKTIKDDGNFGEENYTSVAEAFAGVGNSFTNIKNEINKEISQVVSDSLVKWDEKTNLIKIGSEKDGANINIAGRDNKDRILSGVKKAKNDNEAVNKGQLDASLKDLSNNLQSDESAVVLYDKTEGENSITNYESITFGKGKNRAPVGLHNVADGTICEKSCDAIAGGQLHTISQEVAKYLGGGTSFNDGIFTGPTYKLSSVDATGEVEEKSYNDVGSAFGGLDTNVKNVSNNLTNKFNELTQNITNITQEVQGDALLWNKDKEAFVAQHGENKESSKITSLANGNIAEGSTDAVTGSQLYLMSNQLALYFGGGAGYKDGVWAAPKFEVAQFKSDGSAGDKKGYDNVAEAFEGVNGSMTSMNERINEVTKNVSSNSLNWDEQEGAYNAGHADKDNKITHLADGKVGKDSKEAVNGGQLFETNERVSAVESQVNSIDKQVQDIATATDGAVKYNKDEEGHKTNKISLLGGNESDPVLIDNVANGRIENGSKEAINGGQLHDYTEEQMKIVLDDAKKYTDDKVSSVVNHAADEAKSYTDMKFETLSYAVEDVRKEARQAAAIGLAVANLSYDDTPGKLSVTFGSGVWRSQSAFALGAGYMSENGRMRSNVSVTSAGGHWGVGAGFRITLN